MLSSTERARRAALPRYPIEPLMAAVGAETRRHLWTLLVDQRYPITYEAFRRRVKDWELCEDDADEWAVAFGMHAFQVWPEWFDRAHERATEA